MDLIMHTDFTMLEEFNAFPGTMHLVDRAKVDSIVARHKDVLIIPGGSCANTLRGLSWLLGSDSDVAQPIYIGAVGKDPYGTQFEEILGNHRVRPCLSFKETPTGVSGIMVTPDHERTMFTYLGACRDLVMEDIEFDLICSSEYIYMTGYMWDTENQKAVVKHAVTQARGCGIRIAFDLADPFVVLRYGTELIEWIPGNVDILFANKEELSMITGFGEQKDVDPETVLFAARELAEIIVMKTGSAGCMLSERGNITVVPGYRVNPLDTTSAGDAFAGGFLYGLIRGYDLNRCCMIANSLASQIVTVEGCNYTALNLDCIQMV